MTLTTVCYLLVNIAYFTVISPAEMMASGAVAITFGDRVFKDFAFIVPLGVACSTFGAANGSAFTAARISYAAAKNRHFPNLISYLSHSRYTPLMAVVFNCTMATIMARVCTAILNIVLKLFGYF